MTLLEAINHIYGGEFVYLETPLEIIDSCVLACLVFNYQNRIMLVIKLYNTCCSSYYVRSVSNADVTVSWLRVGLSSPTWLNIDSRAHWPRSFILQHAEWCWYCNIWVIVYFVSYVKYLINIIIWSIVI